jgi:hypothetical protein
MRTQGSGYRGKRVSGATTVHAHEGEGGRGGHRHTHAETGREKEKGRARARERERERERERGREDWGKKDKAEKYVWEKSTELDTAADVVLLSGGW